MRCKYKIIVVTWIILLLAACQSPSLKTTTEVTLALDALFQDWNKNTPGGVLTIQKGDQIIYNKAFGAANLEYDIPNTTNTIFETGSVAKQFTAAAIFLLALDGKLSLPDDIRKYLPELPDYGYKITIYHLIHHTSGMRDWSSIAALAGRARGTFVYTNAHVLDILIRQEALNFPPGDQYNYSNSNYNLLAIIAERVSGQTLQEFTKERIFQPLGMKNTQWREDYRRTIPNRASAYIGYGKKYYLNMPFENVYGQGGLLTTTEDLLKWNQQYKTLPIGGKPLLDLQLQLGKLNNGSILAYAGGLFIRNYQDVMEISHGGSTAGYRAWLAYYPKEDISVAFLSNNANTNPEKIGGQVAEIILGKRLITPIPKTITLSQRKLKKYLGRYKSLRNDELFELDLKDGGLYLKGYQIMRPTTPYTFHWGASRMEFSDDLQRVLVYTGNGDSATFVRKIPTQLPVDALPQYLGAYRSEEAETTIQIEMPENQLMGFQRPDVFYLLESIYEDAFVNSKNQLFQFQRDSSGIVDGFKWSSPRAQGVWFEKLGSESK